jgi:preprotein translocase subunit SecG
MKRMKKIIFSLALVFIVNTFVLMQKNDDKGTPPKKDPPVVIAPDKDKKPPKERGRPDEKDPDNKGKNKP